MSADKPEHPDFTEVRRQLDYYTNWQETKIRLDQLRGLLIVLMLANVVVGIAGLLTSIFTTANTWPWMGVLLVINQATIAWGVFTSREG